MGTNDFSVTPLIFKKLCEADGDRVTAFFSDLSGSKNCAKRMDTESLQGRACIPLCSLEKTCGQGGVDRRWKANLHASKSGFWGHNDAPSLIKANIASVSHNPSRCNATWKFDFKTTSGLAETSPSLLIPPVLRSTVLFLLALWWKEGG